MNPFDVVKNINNKSGILEDVSGVSMFMVVRAFSNTRDTVLLANEVNKARLTPEQQYKFLYHAVPKNPKRFGQWHKNSPLESDIELIMHLYGYSRRKAEEVYPLFDVQKLREMGVKGGKS